MQSLLSNSTGLFTFPDVDRHRSSNESKSAPSGVAAKVAAYADLCASCLREDPASRPTFAQVARSLEGMIAASGGSGGLEEGLRLLVCLLRERTICGIPARDRMRHGLLHWLAFRVGVGPTSSFETTVHTPSEEPV